MLDLNKPARPSVLRLVAAALGAGVLLISATAATAGVVAPQEGRILYAGAPNALPGSYVVVLKDSAAVRAAGVPAVAQQLAGSHDGAVSATFATALRGFSVLMTEAQAKRLAAHADVAYVEQDRVFTIADTQINPPSWGLDRIDQRNLPLDQSYTYNTSGDGVTVYIIDTGIRFSHTTFGGRAVSGRDTVNEDNDASDCNGHGTHVAGTVGGSQYGVAKDVTLVGVRVLSCSGSGTTTNVVQGIDWVTANADDPAVANMSLGGGISTAIDNAVNNSINSGVTYAVAAGNESTNACNRSPARVGAAITVGATGSNDVRASFSNFGTCLDLFAPGVGITSAWWTSNTATNTISGTSMAAPHAAGAAALILEANPSFTPAQVRSAMVANATPGVVGNPGSGSPNLLLYTLSDGPPPPPPDAVFFDDFETSQGWTLNPNGTDTATTGQWQRANPAQTSNVGSVMQLGTTVSGVNDLVTGASAGTSVGSFDIDGGVTSVQSPLITLPSSGTLTLTYSWYLAHLNNATSADFFRVSVVSGSTATLVHQQLGSATTRVASWTTATINLSSFAGQTIRLRIEAADASTASLVEAGVDDVRITAS